MLQPAGNRTELGRDGLHMEGAPTDHEQRATGHTRMAVILPCLHEAPAIAGVIAAFRLALPGASIYVFDNGSTDGTGATTAMTIVGRIASIIGGGSDTTIAGAKECRPARGRNARIGVGDLAPNW